MIDTVTLVLARKRISRFDLDGDKKPLWNSHTRADGYEKFIRKPSKKERQSGLYFPKITGINSNGKNVLMPSRIKITFSVPKLLYGNNLDEVNSRQLDEVIEVLQMRLDMMGIKLSNESIRDASVATVDYSKNISLGNRYTVSYVIGELEKLNVRRGIEFAKAQYRNDGQGLIAQASEHSFVFYDKVPDLLKGRTKAIDKDRVAGQIELAESLQGQNILRFEVRLATKRKINAVFIRLGYAKNPSLIDVLSEEKSMAVLRDYWAKATIGNGGILFADKLLAKDLIRRILALQKHLKPRTMIYLVGLIVLARERGGMRELRNILGKSVGYRSWYRIVKTLKDISASLTGLQPDKWYERIETALKSYQPFRTNLKNAKIK